MARTDAEESPSPPMWSGRWAMARDVAGMGPVSRSWVKQAATAVSWSWANVAVSSGASMRR